MLGHLVKSDYILGRERSRIEWYNNRPFTVSLYYTRWGQPRYSDPVVSRPKNTVKLRYNIKPKLVWQS